MSIVVGARALARSAERRAHVSAVSQTTTRWRWRAARSSWTRATSQTVAQTFERPNSLMRPCSRSRASRSACTIVG